MTVESEKRTRFFRLWTVITDAQGVFRAMRSVQYVAFYLTFSYLLQTILLLLQGETQYTSPPANSEQLYFELGLYSGISVLSLWLGVRIRNGKYGAVPYVAGWMLVEIVFSIVTAPWYGGVGAVIFGVIAVSGLRGWFSRKKYGVASLARKRSWLLIGCGTVFGSALLALCAFGLLIEVGVFPDLKVVSGENLSSYHIQTLLDRGILDESDSIEYFYSYGLFSVADGGQFLTPTKLVIYEEIEGVLSVYELPYSKIDSVELVTQGGFLEDSLYLIYGNSRSEWEYVAMFLGVENGGDQTFIDRLNKHIADYKAI
ncbi:hypothetical protein [Denitrobaculum tricleocarpae]|uniref:Uncharacterized protein n=1 Tax=Denitrobaculum tricleocarpae TaxID=2591009 RepID=A0A545TU63_9PROT|nr:hypothetical protein [Denitrobaculum tricleocarpae]TQV80759.1 hypothetical protein FKG95_11445 [Denitrobaculum tricleocarpae]